MRRERSVILRCRISYSLWNSVQYALQKLPVRIMDVSYAEDVVVQIAARIKDTESVILQLRNLSDGKMDCETVSEDYMDWDL